MRMRWKHAAKRLFQRCSRQDKTVFEAKKKLDWLHLAGELFLKSQLNLKQDEGVFLS